MKLAQKTAFQAALALNETGVELQHANRHEEAIITFDKALKLNPNSAARINKGNSLRALGRHEDAIECFNEEIKRNPRNSDAYYSKGNVLGDLGRFEEAIAAFDKALEINPDDTEARRYRELAIKYLKGNVE